MWVGVVPVSQLCVFGYGCHCTSSSLALYIQQEYRSWTSAWFLASALAIDSAVQITDSIIAFCSNMAFRAARAKYTNMVLVVAAAQTTDDRIAFSDNTGLDFSMVPSCCRTRNSKIALIGSTDYGHQHDLRQPPRPPTSTWPGTVLMSVSHVKIEGHAVVHEDACGLCHHMKPY